MGANRVGQRIHVYWSDETSWFSGVVQQYSPSQGYYVVYDDGDERWEGLNESYRFDGQQSESEDEEEKEDQQIDVGLNETKEEVVVRVMTPRAMEPPGSEEDDPRDEDNLDDSEHLEAAADAHEHEERAKIPYDVPPEPDRPREPFAVYPKPVLLQDDDDTNSEENGDHDDDARSVALTEVPITYEPPRVQRQASVHCGIRRALPYRGTLRGIVVGAANLPLVHQHEEPTAFARVAFAEAGSSSDTVSRRQSNALMLQCKQTLAATDPVPRTCQPMWNETMNIGSSHGCFQLQVVPPMIVTAGGRDPQPAWQQLKGDLLFSVYHHEEDVSRRSEFIGQASIPLHRLARDLLESTENSLSLQIPLESRQGKRLSGSAELTLLFEFETEYPPDQRRPTTIVGKQPSTNELRLPTSAQAVRSSTTPSIASSKPRHTSAGVSTRVRNASGAKASRSHTSSSEINRRKFEKQLEHENKAMAKRMAEHRRESGAAAARRQQLNHQPLLVKSEPKPGVMAVATAPRRSHKASSAINRSKFIDQVKQENQSMGKRLIERVGLSGNVRRETDSKGGEELDWDDAKAQDKAHVADKRRMLREQKDYLLEKAQAKYQQQSELVEDVMKLQTEVAEWKSKLFTVKSNLQRVDAMNTKDTHVRDCLRRATTKTQQDTRPLSTTRSSASLEQLLRSESDDEDNTSDPATQKQKSELRELLREATHLESEKQRLEDQLMDLGKQEASRETEILELHRKWQFVQSKRAFQAKMAAERANPVRAAYTTKEMRAKKHSMDLSIEEEEQYAIFQAQEELTQLQIATTVLRDRVEKHASGATPRQLSRATSSNAACDYLRDKIAKRKAKIQALEAQQSDWRRQYEELVVNGEYEKLRAHAQELQHLLFLCQSEAKHVAAAERVAKHSQDKMAMDLQKQRFQEQTETEILLKKSLH